jgi:hypothetical protein
MSQPHAQGQTLIVLPSSRPRYDGKPAASILRSFIDVTADIASEALHPQGRGLLVNPHVCVEFATIRFHLLALGSCDSDRFSFSHFLSLVAKCANASHVAMFIRPIFCLILLLHWL